MVKSDDQQLQHWDRTRVSEKLFKLLIGHKTFLKEPRAVKAAHCWMSAIDAARERNDRKPVYWDWKDIENRFRHFKQPYTAFRDVLRYFGLIKFSERRRVNLKVPTARRKYTITREGRTHVFFGNLEWLYYLVADIKVRQRNKKAVAMARYRRKKSPPAFTEPIKQIIDDFNREVKFVSHKMYWEVIKDANVDSNRAASVLHLAIAYETYDFCELEIKGGRIYYEFVALPKEYKSLARFKRKSYVGTVQIRDCLEAFLGKFLSLHSQVSALGDECIQWTSLFTDNNVDPYETISKESGLAIDVRDMKKCLSAWLNGGKGYRRSANGKMNTTHIETVEKWFAGRFPKMAKAWASIIRGNTGNLITERFEGPLMLDPAMYAYGESLGLTLSYEYDGVGVFAEPDEKELPAKLEKVMSFIQRLSVDKFNVPIVLKPELISASQNV